MKYPTQVNLCECWARDGLQNQIIQLDTDDKVEMLNLLSEVGFSRIEATSFSHPKHIPQFKDAEEVLKRIDRRKDLKFKATCVNKKALERAIQTKKLGYGPEQISFVMAASEAYNLVNVRMSQNELLKQIDEMIVIAKREEIDVLVSVSTAFGCPINGEVTEEQVLKLVDHFVEKGISTITIGDTTGMANPSKSLSLFKKLLESYPTIKFVAHFHDTKGWGIANALKALESGITNFDVSLGGIGGPPAERIKKGERQSGNVCTEDFVFMLEDMGISTGLNLSKLIEAGRLSEKFLGTQKSKMIYSF